MQISYAYGGSSISKETDTLNFHQSNTAGNQNHQTLPQPNYF